MLVAKARLGARTGPPPLYIIDGVVYDSGAAERLGLASLNIVSVEVVKNLSCGGYPPGRTPSVITITTRRGSARGP